jgi:uncharacterized protein (TIGR03000 family)
LATAALIAAAVFLTPGRAPAQVRFALGGGVPFGGFGYGGVWGGGFGGPFSYPSYYLAPSYRSSFLYYQTGLPYNPIVNNPFLAPGVPLTPAGYGMPLGFSSPSLGFNSIGGFYGPAYAGGGYGSALMPLASAGPLGGYGSYYDALGGYRFANVAYGGTPWVYPAYVSGLSNVPYTPGLDFNYISPAPMRAPLSHPVASPTGSSNVLLSVNTVRMRSDLAPAVAVRPGDNMIKEALGPADGDRTAKVVVTLPTADAKVWFGKSPTTQTGKVREYQSPPLDADATYTYEIRAEWMSDGEPVTRTRTVRVRAGQRIPVDFTTK